jgi:hypothetical protein
MTEIAAANPRGGIIDRKRSSSFTCRIHRGMCRLRSAKPSCWTAQRSMTSCYTWPSFRLALQQLLSMV